MVERAGMLPFFSKKKNEALACLPDVALHCTNHKRVSSIPAEPAAPCDRKYGEKEILTPHVAPSGRA